MKHKDAVKWEVSQRGLWLSDKGQTFWLLLFLRPRSFPRTFITHTYTHAHTLMWLLSPHGAFRCSYKLRHDHYQVARLCYSPSHSLRKPTRRINTLLFPNTYVSLDHVCELTLNPLQQTSEMCCQWTRLLYNKAVLIKKKHISCSFVSENWTQCGKFSIPLL